MADFVAVLRKTIDGLGDTTPEMRARVYDKARATISAKLAAITPPPAPAVIERQKAALEQAISSLESEYVAAAPVDADDFESVIASLERQPEQVAKPAKAPPAPANGSAAPKTEPRAPVANAPETSPAADTASSDSLVVERTAPDALPGMGPASLKAARSGRGGLIAVALIVLVFAGAAGYAVWLNRDEVSTMLGFGDPQPVAQKPAPAAPATPAPAPVAAAPETPAAPPADQAVSKFTQKLNADGTEVDPGPAEGEPGVGEGTSVAALTVPPPETPAPPLGDAAQPATPAAPDANPATPATMPTGQTPAPEAATETPPPPSETQPQPAAIAVGQRAIFYEERTSASGGSAQQGNIVWSLVQESPGGDQPAEAAIRADATIPGKDVQLRMTIRRNADPTLPASHIVELIFLTPENFEGGVIDNLLRMTMKETEEATGNPILGLPAKIGDGFFLIALSDGKPELDANMQLFRRMKWIDIPIVYRSGRRALMTLERGIPGDKVFEEAIQAWSQANG